MNDEAAIRERMATFLTDALCWNEKFPLSAATHAHLAILESAEVEKKILSSRHGVNCDSLDSLALSEPPEHSPVAECVVAIHWHSREAVLVTTSNRSGSPSQDFEYELIKVQDEWRISRIRRVFGDKSLSPADAEVLQTLHRSPPPTLHDIDLPKNLAQLFEKPSLISTENGEVETTVCSSGLLLPIPSGWIACDDPADWHCRASTFELAVPPGEYPLKLVHGGHEPIAVGVLIQPSAPVVRYCKATRLMASNSKSRLVGHQDTSFIGVDTGRIGLADAESLYAMSLYEREKMDDLAARTPPHEQTTGVTVSPMTNGVNALAFSTRGDGGFPAYWALDAQNAPVALWFEFPYLAEPCFEEFSIPIVSTQQPASNHPFLTEAGVAVHLRFAEGSGTVDEIITTPSEERLGFAISDASGKILLGFDDSCGSGCSETENSLMLAKGFQLPAGGQLHVRRTIGRAYRVLPPLPQTAANSPEAFTMALVACGCQEKNGALLHQRIKNQYGSAAKSQGYDLKPSRRYYHNWRHLTECLIELGNARPHFGQCDLAAVEMELCFHYVIYNSQASDNEEESARLSTLVLKQGNAPDSVIAKVTRLIMATKAHSDDADPDVALLLDIDLSILGQPAPRYQAYEEAIRLEYSWVPFALFADARRRILSRFLERPFIYQTTYFRNLYEAEARNNLHSAIQALAGLPR